MGAIKFTWQPAALHVAEGGEEPEHVLAGGLKCHISDDDLGPKVGGHTPLALLGVSLLRKLQHQLVAIQNRALNAGKKGRRGCKDAMVVERLVQNPSLATRTWSTSPQHIQTIPDFSICKNALLHDPVHPPEALQ